MSTLNVQYYFQDQEFLASPQTFNRPSSETIVSARTFLDAQASVGPPDAIPGQSTPIRNLCTWGSVSPYNLEFTWNQIVAGNTGVTHNVSTRLATPVAITVTYNGAGYTLPLMGASMTFEQVRQYFAGAVIGGSATNLDITIPTILTNSARIGDFAHAPTGSVSDPYTLGISMMQSPLYNVFVYVLGATAGSVILVATLQMFPNWTIAALEVALKQAQGRTAPSQHSYFYALDDTGLEWQYADNMLLSTLAVGSNITILSDNGVATRTTNVFGFWGLTGPIAVETVVDSTVVDIVDRTQQYLPQVLGIYSTDAFHTSMANFTLALSLLPSPLTVPVRSLPLLPMLQVVPDDATNYVIQDTFPPQIAYVSLMLVNPPTLLTRQNRLLTTPVVDVRPNFTTMTISGHSSGFPIISDPTITLADMFGGGETLFGITLYLLEEAPVDVSVLLPTGSGLVIHGVTLDTPISGLVSLIQTAVGPDFNVINDTFLFHGSTQLSMGSPALLDSFSSFNFVLQWVGVTVFWVKDGITAYVQVPRISSPSTTVLDVIASSIQQLHLVIPFPSQYTLSIGADALEQQNSFFPYFSAGQTYYLRLAFYAGNVGDIAIVAIGIVLTLLSTLFFGVMNGQINNFF